MNPAQSWRKRIEAAGARALLGLPASFIERISGEPEVRDGRTLDPEVALALKLIAMSGQKLPHETSVVEARRDLDATGSLFAPLDSPLAAVTDMRIDGAAGLIDARLYRPIGAARPGPGLVFFHGGGWVVGSLASHDATCRALAARSGCVVISVDYRLAPEHPFPAAPDDAVAAFRNVAKAADQLGLDPHRLSVGGDSAGGHLATVVARETRGDAIRPCLQVLIYPVTDGTMSMPSYQSCAEGFFLERRSMQWFFSHYLPYGTDPRDPRVSPLFADDLTEMPPAFVATAGFDPLRDEGDAYAKKLSAAGNTVEHRSYSSLIHGFFNLSGAIGAARQPFRDIVEALAATRRSGMKK